MTAEPRPAAIRPLLYDRLRLYLGGQAEYVGALIDHDLDGLYKELERLRSDPSAETSIEDVKDEIVHLVNARKDITTGLLDERMEYLKVRLYRGGQADTIRELLLEEQDRQLEHLGDLRAKGLLEQDEEIIDTRNRLVWLSGALRDMGTVLMNLAGPDADPR